MAQADRQKLTAGLVLILLGIGFFALQRAEGVGDEVVLLIIGAAFLVAYFYQRSYGLLIPAGILLGLGTGKLLEGVFWWADDGSELGLGVGFISIYVIARLYQRQSHWWPLIPGGILVLVGLEQTGMIFRWIFRNWPLVLVVIGALILIGAFRRARGEPEPSAPPAAEPQQPVEPEIE